MGYPGGYGDALVQAASHDTNAYALYVSGNSMAPRMRPGEAILVEPGQEAAPGDEVVVKIVERPNDPNLTGGAVMVKEFASQRDGRIALDSIADHEERILVHRQDIEFMHYVAGTFRAGSIRPRGGQ